MPLVVTMGDPAGIGPELLLAAWRNRAEFGLPPFYVLADPDVMRTRARDLAIHVGVATCTPEEVEQCFASALPVVTLENRADTRSGADAPASPDAVVEAIATAVAHVKAGLATGMVTSPITKKSLYAAGFKYPGHTEYLGALAATHWPDEPAAPVMMLAGPDLRTVPITVHIPIHAIPQAWLKERIIEVARITARDLETRFGIATPRLVLAGLNPHAGEGGTIGHEDETVSRPAVEQLRAEGIDIAGPLPADTLFHARARKGYDAALCAYHDQALIPVKTLAFDETVNVTLGLPFVRTSPDHGTAFDIAGKGIARPDSLVAAIRLADQLSRDHTR
ncbi:4-hydroxythreonine-4-phosphate dehydrogenase [Breoghania corrubedonensis]|uniref:4-hydroxythreonine-4-phosphate dehydrogenase n=1 Tax=Breoghania corrubedonensis TaxID=665038 RepID=A0A2T5V9L4_9HYPH|nr:4-hydroxythreonine-4-phosphate dehydrogenase PdxA [Breoghania corrubedonensis]PTW60438.1 4-hydroxythreonine-4-phosphate dehydrogenase [Breoghania corrubedonensis]